MMPEVQPIEDAAGHSPKVATNAAEADQVKNLVQAGTITGGVHLHGAGPAAVVPRHLPPAPRTFAGRDKELAQLSAALVDGAAARGVAMVCGPGGIGKTWLTLNWSHEHIDRFPDGQLFSDLRGFDATGDPKSPDTVLHCFLESLGVEPERIPVTLDAKAGLYRSLVDGRRMLIVLDNAQDVRQVAPLLPGSPKCTVLITGRNRLDGLFVAHDARSVALDVLPESEARRLLTRRLGPQRLADEPDAANDLLASCAGLPLALAVVAGRVTAHPGFPLTKLAAELQTAPTRLDALAEGEPATNLSTVLSWSYAALTDQQAEVFRLVSLAPGLDISLLAVANLVGLSTSETTSVLSELERVSLIQQHTPGRFRIHDLIRLYGIQQAHAQAKHAQLVALRRLVDFYVHTSYAANQLLDPDSQAVTMAPPTAGCRPAVLETRQEALEWFRTEHAPLLTAQQFAHRLGWHTQVWQLAWTLHSFNWWRGHLHHDLSIWQTAFKAAKHLNEPGTQAIVHQMLGNAHSRLGHHDRAVELTERALDFAAATGDPHYEAAACHTAARAFARYGEVGQALRHAADALRLYRLIGVPLREGWALNMVGDYAAQLGDFALARTSCEAALALFREHGYRLGEAAVLDSLGRLASTVGHTDALSHYQRALVLRREIGATYAAAETLERLGNTHQALDQHGQAQAAWGKALDLYQAQRRTADAYRIKQQLESLCQPSSRSERKASTAPR